MMNLREANEEFESIYHSHGELLETLEAVMGAIRWTGWNVDDARWQIPMSKARGAITKAKEFRHD